MKGLLHPALAALPLLPTVVETEPYWKYIAEGSTGGSRIYRDHIKSSKISL